MKHFLSFRLFIKSDNDEVNFTKRSKLNQANKVKRKYFFQVLIRSEAVKNIQVYHLSSLIRFI